MDNEFLRLLANLALATLMVAACVLVHFWGLLSLSSIMRRGSGGLSLHKRHSHQALLIVLTVFGLFAVHTIEIWLYALLYSALGELKTFEEALYFSTATFTTVGYGDVVLSPKWRLLASIEGANGLILIGWSTTFLLGVTSRLRILEHAWLSSEEEDEAKVVPTVSE
jgi:hypothetical protein